MYTKRIFGVVALAALALAAAGCASTDQVDQQAATISQQADRISSLESQVSDMADTLENVQSQLDVAPIEATPMAETGHETSAFDVAVAQYFMDTAGFHEMAEALAAGEEIDPAWAATASQVHKVLASTAWPEELDAAADSFVENVGAFAEALANDDAETATELADTVHDAQHDLSHSIDEWMGTATADHTHDE